MMIKGKMNVVIKRKVNKDGLCGNDLYPYSFFFGCFLGGCSRDLKPRC